MYSTTIHSNALTDLNSSMVLPEGRLYDDYHVSISRTVEKERLVIECRRVHFDDDTLAESMRVAMPTNFAISTLGASTHAKIEIYTERNRHDNPESSIYFITTSLIDSPCPQLKLNGAIELLVDIFRKRGFELFKESIPNTLPIDLRRIIKLGAECPIIQNYLDGLTTTTDTYISKKLNEADRRFLQPSFKIEHTRKLAQPNSEFVQVVLDTLPRNRITLDLEFVRDGECAFRPEDYRLNSLVLILHTNTFSHFKYRTHSRRFDKPITLSDLSGTNSMLGNFCIYMINYESCKMPNSLPIAILNDAFSICNLMPANIYTRLRGPSFNRHNIY